ncbi:hypothetical protein SAMN05443667_10716 [Flavobacterium gillisiae]|uniref:Uncharacterized protein n=1 Tax=Flavobacterium gillisiae TaxID=150146 RepID=A0A1H4D2M5_9FLAO|nr:hypothetical protein SAMN05443667_10716 [Flavobacterium gillisiae]
MTKYYPLFMIFLTLSYCGKNANEMIIPENANEKFAEFIAKENPSKSKL